MKEVLYNFKFLFLFICLIIIFTLYIFFIKGNFTSIAGIPKNLRPGEMARARTRHIENNRKTNNSFVSSQVLKNRPKLTKNGMFSGFKYMPSRYSLSDELKKKDRLENDAKVKL